MEVGTHPRAAGLTRSRQARAVFSHIGAACVQAVVAARMPVIYADDAWYGRNRAVRRAREVSGLGYHAGGA